LRIFAYSTANSGKKRRVKQISENEIEDEAKNNKRNVYS
jgi:hypothetical protein